MISTALGLLYLAVVITGTVIGDRLGCDEASAYGGLIAVLVLMMFHHFVIERGRYR